MKGEEGGNGRLLYRPFIVHYGRSSIVVVGGERGSDIIGRRGKREGGNREIGNGNDDVCVTLYVYVT